MTLFGEPTTPFFDFSVPAKVFLLGEYQVLLGQPALVATLSPRFGWMRSNEGGAGEIGTDILSAREFREKSPVGLLRRWFERRGHAHRARDAGVLRPVLGGAGGLGASTAEFALCFEGWGAHRIDPTLAALPRWLAMWKLYRELLRENLHEDLSERTLLPSGADLAAQAHGGIVEFLPGVIPELRPLRARRALPILIFSTTVSDVHRKVATHEHLGKLSESDLDPRVGTRLAETYGTGMSALSREDWQVFGQALSDYGNALRDGGFESSSTTEFKSELFRAARSGSILGVKGSGAMQADLLVVLVDPARPGASVEIINHAEALGLTLVQNGLSLEEAGIQCHDD